MHAVYVVGTQKRPPLTSVEPRKPQSGFFSSLIATLTTSSASRRSEPPPSPPPPPRNLTEVHETSVTLTVYTAEVGVKVDGKLSAELLRSTKKKPPAQLKYNLIYVRSHILALFTFLDC